MPLDLSRLRRRGQKRSSDRGSTVRAVTGVALAAVLVGASISAARAGDDDNPSGWSKFMQLMGLKPASTNEINYTERAPLVVPPSRDLPAPADGAAAPAADWPKDPAKRQKSEKAKTEIMPGTAVQTPNPPFQKKPWYNPAGWFDKEEYASFTGEPVRQNLTDPPPGYRSPSPEQPYGIPPDKGKTQATAKDFGMGSLTPPAGSGH